LLRKTKFPVRIKDDVANTSVGVPHCVARLESHQAEGGSFRLERVGLCGGYMNNWIEWAYHGELRSWGYTNEWIEWTCLIMTMSQNCMYNILYI
jgi:hypothetical protein